MNFYLLVCLMSLVVSSFSLEIEDGVPHFDMDQELTEEELEELKLLVAKEMNLHNLSKLRGTDKDALLNDFLDKILANVRTLILKNHFDPSSLPDESIDIKIGTTHLTEGQLNDTATIQRYENATLKYDSDSRKLIAEMVLRFEDLKFIFRYHTKVTFISMSGHLHGIIEHIHIHAKLGYDFEKELAFVDSVDFKHTGDIQIWFSGNKVIDWITNAMSAVITGILHNVILNIVKNIVSLPIQLLVDGINHILHPSLVV